MSDAATREQIIGHDNPERVERVELTRERLYPVVARPGPAWTWIYLYRADGGPSREYGTGLVDMRRWLRRTFPAAEIVETWRVATGR